ncbi:hypothetical protein BC832DRAFT_560790 [Gaertneriomyces semiglobifer]|nr:hypothetical protein BC832DRAFT_560790 [Gaertneriomyces semiglobifer]
MPPSHSQPSSDGGPKEVPARINSSLPAPTSTEESPAVDSLPTGPESACRNVLETRIPIPEAPPLLPDSTAPTAPMSAASATERTPLIALPTYPSVTLYMDDPPPYTQASPNYSYSTCEPYCSSSSAQLVSDTSSSRTPSDAGEIELVESTYSISALFLMLICMAVVLATIPDWVGGEEEVGAEWW